MHILVTVFCLLTTAVISTSPPDSIEYFHTDDDPNQDLEIGESRQIFPKIFNPMNIPTDDESGSRNSSLETVLFGQTPRKQISPTHPAPPVASSPRSPKSDWRVFSSVSSDSNRQYFRSQNCARNAVYASAALILVAGAILGILYFGFPSSFDKLF